MPSVGEEFAGDDCCGPNLFMHQRLVATPVLETTRAITPVATFVS